jgi:hypothetical protein
MRKPLVTTSLHASVEYRDKQSVLTSIFPGTVEPESCPLVISTICLVCASKHQEAHQPLDTFTQQIAYDYRLQAWMQARKASGCQIRTEVMGR